MQGQLSQKCLIKQQAHLPCNNKTKKNAMISGNPGPITAQMGTQRNSNLCPYFIGRRNQASGRFD